MLLTRSHSFLYLCLFSASVTFGLAQQPQANTATVSVPRLVRIDNSFRPANGSPAKPLEAVILTIYTQQAPGDSPLWQETQNVAIDADGRYSILLGSTSYAGIPADILTSSEPRWLGIRFDHPGEVEQPRLLLATVPYSLKAGDADTLGGRPASAYMLNPSVAAGVSATGSPNGAPTDVNVTTKNAPRFVSNGTVNSIPVFVDNGGDIGNSVMFQNGPRIGLGTANPLDYFHVAFTDTAGGATGLAVQNLGNTSTSYSGMLFYDQNGTLAQFQGFNNSTHEYRINNIAPNGSINFMIGGSSKFLVANNGNIGIGTTSPSATLDIAGTLRASGGVIFPDGTQQVTGALNPLAVAQLKWYGGSQSQRLFFGNLSTGCAMFDGENIWVTNPNSAQVTKFKASDGTSATQVAAQAGPAGILWDGFQAFVMNNTANSITLVMPGGGNPSGNVVGTGPQLAAFDGTYVWVTNTASNNVSKLRDTDGAGVANVAVGAAPWGIAFDGTFIWVAYNGDNKVRKLRTSDGAIVGTFTVGTAPKGVTFDGANIWVANSGSSSVTKLRASDGATLGTYTVGTQPVSLTFDGANMWIANNGSNSITKMRAVDGVILQTFPTLGAPQCGAFDGANIWMPVGMGIMKF